MEIQWIKNGGVTSAQGYCAAGVAAGLKKKGKKDMALLVSAKPAAVGATFTANQVKAAPVKLSAQHAKRGRARAVILNSGNANACTGLRGIHDAKLTASETAKALGCRTPDVLVCSTGRIGAPLPMTRIKGGIKKLVGKLAADGGHAAATAIMTTDTYVKECAVELALGGRRVTIGGMAKGAGMIHPNMATMLCVITTDAAVEAASLRRVTADVVETTFNRISVDGDTSTNDTVFVLANGAVGGPVLSRAHPEFEQFRAALHLVLSKLSRLIIEDGEGITKVVDLTISGAANDADARRAAEAIARSPLVKSSWCGNDPNWGRLMDTIGYSAAKVREELVDIYYNGLLAVKGGLASKTPFARLKKEVSKPAFAINIDLHLGRGCYALWVNDLTEEYVTLNKGE
ncbi:MAG: bifunctional glutamate N-acetyltransferase/amino-acid acetyltransferase ArgJ [Verrucomicrobiales bacterium]|jgi:glutamate N-acetyltransferase/amino-acid N-acetyltransferase|nr:bifunctional glutamate N-acetyltransferase/amino-acid acetyltransferase ArgJ [Verrucomicrobiales bacterium]